MSNLIEPTHDMFVLRELTKDFFFFNIYIFLRVDSKKMPRQLMTTIYTVFDTTRLYITTNKKPCLLENSLATQNCS